MNLSLRLKQRRECPACGADLVDVTLISDTERRYQCTECGRTYSESERVAQTDSTSSR